MFLGAQPSVAKETTPATDLSSPSLAAGWFDFLLCRKKDDDAVKQEAAMHPTLDEIVVSDMKDEEDELQQKAEDGEDFLQNEDFGDDDTADMYHSFVSRMQTKQLTLAECSSTSSSTSENEEEIQVFPDFPQRAVLSPQEIRNNCFVGCFVPSLANYFGLFSKFVDSPSNRTPAHIDKANDILLNSAEFLEFVLEFDRRINYPKPDIIFEDVSVSHNNSASLPEGVERNLTVDDQNNQTPTSPSPLVLDRFAEQKSSPSSACKVVKPPSNSPLLPPLILIPGGGIFYFFKAGFTMYLSQHFDLSRCVFLGTSAGALASTVTLLSGNIAKASRMAIRLAMKSKIWQRSGFLAGLVYDISASWLESVIPQNVDFEAIGDRLFIVAYRLSHLRSECFCRFQSREDLIECLLASIHIPFYANGKASVRARGTRYLDGSFGSDIIKHFAGQIPLDRIVTILCTEEDYTTPIPRKECIANRSPAELLDLFKNGWMYAEKLHRQNSLVALDGLETSPAGSLSILNNPYLDCGRLEDESLDEC